jgi:hypothetical protein
MDDRPELGKRETGSGKREPLSRRAFIEHGAKVGLGFGAASLLANGLWLSPTEAATVDDALGLGDPLLQAKGT